ncbi:dienelactone hydrolase [Pseudoxanthomonas broegbernensis]|uniref:Dienelactone hydrolase n=1 Tax=Pseudoxanthomonas broegbernensis TaxID=83619 RepID=A0A7V8GM09_9GAMM|nr:dienelactone hydrolase family protein [Pseudoxanthomonas broegbernensis]KAF1686192.1 dienelactone hydrolase [Pseudoxanthomonas broegbernensis]
MLASGLAALLALPAAARPRAEPVEWTIGHERFSGFLVYDDQGDARRPGLVMVPNWRGVNESAVAKARQVAGDDYVVLVADVYGKDVRPKDNQEAGRVAGALRDTPALLRARARAAVEALRAQAGRAPLDPARIGAFGFCFGGTTVLELARAGAPLAGVVSLHGGLGTAAPAAPGAVTTPVLVLNGAADKGVGAEDIAGFGREMDAAGADWQFVNFSGAVHCFAEADAGDDPASNCRYDARAARRAYRMLEDFFDERFGD